MKTITINGKALSLKLDPIEKDSETGAQWCNGEIEIDGEHVYGGGGWILSEKTAEIENAERGVNLDANPNWPNAVRAGDFQPYQFGEDESGWETIVMPKIYGENWEDLEDSRDLERSTFQAIQSALSSLV